VRRTSDTAADQDAGAAAARDHGADPGGPAPARQHQQGDCRSRQGGRMVVLPDGTTFPSSSSSAAVAAHVALLSLPALLLSFPSESVSISIGKKGNQLAPLRCELGREGERRKKRKSELSSVCE